MFDSTVRTVQFMAQANDSEAVALPDTQAVVERLLGQRAQFLGFLEKRVGSRALAEDILQEAFVKGLDKLGDLKSDESAVAWFYRILRNAVIDQARRGSVANRALEAFAGELEGAELPAQDTERAVCACVSGLAETLKPEYSAALKRIEIDGVTVKDYADEIGTTSGNAAVRVFRAREALRKQVTKTCGACATHGCIDCTCSHG